MLRRPQSVHHRKPRSIGGSNETRNRILLPYNKHEAWHLLFANFTAECIAEEINKLYLDPDYVIVARKRGVPCETESRNVPIATWPFLSASENALPSDASTSFQSKMPS